MKFQKLQKQAIGLLIGYALEFLLGMTLNLFVTLPKTHPGSTGSSFFGQSGHSLTWALSGAGGGELATHVYVALLLALGSLSLFVRALQLGSKRWSIAGGIAALFTIGALFNGLSFLDFNKDFSSMIMATCWLVAVASLVVGIVSHPTPLPNKSQKA